MYSVEHSLNRICIFHLTRCSYSIWSGVVLSKSEGFYYEEEEDKHCSKLYSFSSPSTTFSTFYCISLRKSCVSVGQSGDRWSSLLLFLTWRSLGQPTRFTPLRASDESLGHILSGKKASPFSETLRNYSLTPPTSHRPVPALWILPQQQPPLLQTRSAEAFHSTTDGLGGREMSVWKRILNTVWHNSDVVVFFCCKRTPGCFGDWRNVM